MDAIGSKVVGDESYLARIFLRLYQCLIFEEEPQNVGHLVESALIFCFPAHQRRDKWCQS